MSRYRISALAGAALGVAAIAAPAASAAAPSFSRCPTSTPDVVTCVETQSTAGDITANGHKLDLGSSINVQGGYKQDPVTLDVQFVPPTSGPALVGQPVTIASASIGLPASYTTVTATVEQVGAVNVAYPSWDLTVPARVKFTNPLLGANCAVGSAASPISLHLATTDGGTLVTFPGSDTFQFAGVKQADATFAVPAATNCGAAYQSTVTKAINKYLGLPSAAGNNSASLTEDVSIGLPTA